MKVLVTGGTGLLGNTIVRQLSDQGHDVVAFVRRDPDERVFADTNAEIVLGDLLHPESLEDAIASSDVVIHSAGLIHIGWQRLDESMTVNRDATAAIADAARRHNKKLIYIGSVNAMAIGTRDQASDENVPLDYLGGQVPCVYVVSKLAGVEVVKQAVRQGLRASIVHPGFMLGPWDWKPSSGRMILEVARGWKPIAPAGGCSVCDSRDVAAATINAIELGRDDGREFIVAGDNWSYYKLWCEIAARTFVRKPLMPAGPMQRWIGAYGGDLLTRLRGREGDVNSASVAMSSMFHFHDSTRAMKELGYRRRPIGQTLDDAVTWLRKHDVRPPNR